MHPYIITIAQQKGGAGKSTLASHLSVAFAKLGAKTAILDTDPQQTIMSWRNIRDKNKSVNKVTIDVASSTGWKVNNEIARFSKCDIIVIDSPPHMEAETRSAIRAANLVIVPCQPSPNDLWATDKTLEIVNKEGKKMVLVLNRCPYQSKLLKQIEAHFDSSITKYFLGNRVAFASSMLLGLTSIETEPNSSATNEILQIAENIYNSI